MEHKDRIVNGTLMLCCPAVENEILFRWELVKAVVQGRVSLKGVAPGCSSFHDSGGTGSKTVGKGKHGEAKEFSLHGLICSFT